jgi:LuxR family maltose regulon positive regulatory protein
VLDGDWDRDLAVEVRALTLVNLGIAELWAGATEAAGEHLQQAVGLALEASNDFVLFLAESYAAAADAQAGRLADATARAEIAIELAERHGWTQLAHAAMANVALASVHLWRGELVEAERFAEPAAVALAGASDPLLGPALSLLRAGLLALNGEPLTALDVVRGATAKDPLPRLLHVSAGLLEADLWLALGEPDRTRRVLAGLDAPEAAVGLARLELAAGDPEAALGAVAAIRDDEREPVLPFARVEATVLEAVALDALRDEQGALAALEHALDMAEPRGCAIVIVRQGAPLRSLLRRLMARGTRHRALGEELLAMLERSSGPEPVVVGPLLEPLSDRELTVLRFLPTMMSNAEIAAEMYVSVNTVKTHLKHVYRKLDVTDRRDCVRRGRELRLLSPGLGDG